MTYKVLAPIALCIVALGLMLPAILGLLGRRAARYCRRTLMTFGLGVAYFFFAPVSITCFAYWRCDDEFEPNYGGGSLSRRSAKNIV